MSEGRHMHDPAEGETMQERDLEHRKVRLADDQDPQRELINKLIQSSTAPLEDRIRELEEQVEELERRVAKLEDTKPRQ